MRKEERDRERTEREIKSEREIDREKERMIKGGRDRE